MMKDEEVTEEILRIYATLPKEMQKAVLDEVRGMAEARDQDTDKILRFKYASIKIHNVLFLTMDLSNLNWSQQLYKVDLFCKINHNLHLRKRPAQAIWEMRVGGEWFSHTSIVLCE